jgi:hypothetical protein
MDGARCMVCIPPGKRDAVMIYLLCQLAQGAGISSITCGVIDPVTAPTGNCGMYVNIAAGTIWYWDNTTLAWIQFAGGGAGGVSCGIVDPTVAPTGTCGFYSNTLTGSVWYWDNPSLAWVKFLG